MNAVITVIGKDEIGILSKVSAQCAKAECNIRDVTQSILEGYYTLIMLVDGEKMNCTLLELKEAIKGELPAMETHIMHEDIFHAMHSI